MDVHVLGRYAYVMMIQDKWWKRFQNRHQQGKMIHSYVKTGRAHPKNTALILFYVTKPMGQVAGYAEFVELKAGNALELWAEHGDESALDSKGQYEAFIKGREKVAFIRFKNLHEATKPLSCGDLLMELGKRRLARAGFYIDKETAEKLIALME
jgi:predicted transcriptional regulator